MLAALRTLWAYLMWGPAVEPSRVAAIRTLAAVPVIRKDGGLR